jgi:transposase
MTITGVNVTVALSLVAAIGDIKRFSSPEKLVSYFGLNPRVRQSGDKPAYHGRITKQGRAHARSMLVEAAWVISGVPGPLRAFFIRIRDKRGKQVAAVATAAQAGGHRLAHADQERGLYLDPPAPPGLGGE